MPKLEKFGFFALTVTRQTDLCSTRALSILAGCYRVLPDAGKYPEKLSSKQVPSSRLSTDLR
jgi:hypothetical protein